MLAHREGELYPKPTEMSPLPSSAARGGIIYPVVCALLQGVKLPGDMQEDLAKKG